MADPPRKASRPGTAGGGARRGGARGAAGAAPGRWGRDGVRAAAPSLALALALALAAAALGAGCGEPDGVVVRVSAKDFSVATHLTHLEITVAASGEPEGVPVCTPYTDEFLLDPGRGNYVELPLAIRVRPGGRYDRILYVRVRGFFKDMLRLQMTRMVSLRGGEVVVEMEMLDACLGIATGADEHCVSGVAVPSPYHDIFETPDATDAAEWVQWEGDSCVQP